MNIVRIRWTKDRGSTRTLAIGTRVDANDILQLTLARSELVVLVRRGHVVCAANKIVTANHPMRISKAIRQCNSRQRTSRSSSAT